MSIWVFRYPPYLIALSTFSFATPNGWFYPEFVAEFGAATPDYRGMFLRGYGGKSAGLGEKQEESVHISKDAGIFMTLEGISKGAYYETTTSGGDYDAWVNGEWTRVEGSRPTTSVNITKFARIGSTVANKDITNANANGVGVGGSITLSISINSTQDETVPANRAVKYIIKAR